MKKGVMAIIPPTASMLGFYREQQETYRYVKRLPRFEWNRNHVTNDVEHGAALEGDQEISGIPSYHVMGLMEKFFTEMETLGTPIFGEAGAQALPGLVYHVVSSNGFLQEGYPAPYFDDPEVAVVTALESLKDIVKDIKSPRLFILRRWPELSYNPKEKGWCFTARLAVISTEWTDMNRVL